MISSATTKQTETLVIDKPVGKLSPRIMELRAKIQNEEYLENAIQRIAQVISDRLIENPDELKLRDSES